MLFRSAGVRDLDEFPFPDYDDQPSEGLRRRVAEAHAAGRAASGGMECTIWETAWYLRGTEHAAESAPAWVKILAPTEGEWMARDPDIPGMFQKIPLRASGDPERLATLEWRMDDASLGAVGEASTVSIPERGPHQLKLVDTGTGAVVDEVRFIVR